MSKNVILQMQIENILQELMIRTASDNVIVDSITQETLATRLATLASKIASLESNENVTTEQVQTIVNDAIDQLIGSAPDTYDTLQEIAEYIDEHEDVVQSINAAIGNKVDKKDGYGLSKNDFTDALLNKLNSIAEGATKVEKSDTNGNIKVNGEEVKVYSHPTGNGYQHLPQDGNPGQVLRGAGNGTGTWGVPVRSGVSEPPDLAEGELFIKMLN